MALMIVYGLIGCGQETVPAPLHILLVTVDTARADRFSFQADSPVETAHLDRLAAAGTVFRDATAHTPITLPSHASILTGLLPQRHGIRTNGSRALSPESTTLAEILAGRGFQTAAFVSSPVLSSRYGLDQGFEHYDELGSESPRGPHFYPERPAAETIEALESWLAALDRSRSSFVWLHLFDPHHPYSPPEPERTRYRDNPYDGEIAYVDRALGGLFGRYEELGLRDRWLVILTADHGEALGEHGESTHGLLIHQSTVHVPLVFSGVGVPPGAVRDRPVSHVDVVPTTLALAGLETDLSFDGRDVFAPGEAGAPAPVYVESLFGELHHGWESLRGVRVGPRKLVRGVFDELFDLSSDPGEVDDLAGRSPAGDLSRELDRFTAMETGTSSRPAGPLSEAERDELLALGYVPSVTHRPPPEGTSRQDPRERVVTLEKGNRALTAFSAGRRSEALSLMGEIVRESPGSAFYWELYGSMLAAVQEREAALEAFATSCDLNPENGEAWKNRGALLAQLGRLEPAVVAYERARRLLPNDGDLAVRLEKLGARLAAGQGGGARDP